MQTLLEAEAQVQRVTTALRTITNPIATVTETDAETPRIHVLDRIALRVGVALLLWGARTRRVCLAYDAHRRIHHTESERAARESAAAREMFYSSLLR